MRKRETRQSLAHRYVSHERRSSERLTVVRDSGVAVVTLNRPRRRNALDRELLLALKDTVGWLRADTDTRVVVLTGAGDSFCAGVDISAEGRRDFYMPPQQNERLYQERGQDIVWGLQSLPQVTVAAVNGPAIGWGTGLATSCDFRFVSDKAFFRIPEIGFGMYYDVGCLYGLLSLVGPAQARRLTMLGEDIDAQEAKRIGLVDQIVSSDELGDVARGWARDMADRATDAVRLVKMQLYASTNARKRHLASLEIELMSCYYDSNTDRYEGLAARENGRLPVFSREARKM